MLRRSLFKLKQTVCKVVIVPKPRNPQACGSTRRQRPGTGSTHMLKFSYFDCRLSKFFIHGDHLGAKAENMNLAEQQFKPPARVRGMMVLDKSQFEDILKVPAITVPMKSLNKITKQMKKYGLKVKGLSPVVELEKTDPNCSSHKKFLFDPRKVKSVDDLPDDIKEVLAKENLMPTDFEIYDLKLSYENWNFQEIMQAILPDNIDGVAGYSEVGHIAHFNLREQALPYKHIIGEVLLDKIPSLKTVVNKLNTIDNAYRTFEMELLAGEDNFITQTKENGCVYELDFSKVYWNSRLGTEHHRMTKDLKCTDIVFDVFAGTGPFAIPAARRRAIVYANDLNPFSYESLVRNIKLNSCDSSLITCSNLDGREFIQTVVKQKLTCFYSETKTFEEINKENITGISILMNLPALAYTFLDAFRGLLCEVEDFNANLTLPIVHCYCFTNLTEATEKWGGDMNIELKHRVLEVVGGLKEEDLALRLVRDVAPQKVMMCVSFTLTPEVLCGRPKRQLKENNVMDEPPAKSQKLGTI